MHSEPIPIVPSSGKRKDEDLEWYQDTDDRVRRQKDERRAMEEAIRKEIEDKERLRRLRLREEEEDTRRRREMEEVWDAILSLTECIFSSITVNTHLSIFTDVYVCVCVCARARTLHILHSHRIFA